MAASAAPVRPWPSLIGPEKRWISPPRKALGGSPDGQSRVRLWLLAIHWLEGRLHRFFTENPLQRPIRH
jgi:hypothetical protein